MSELIEIAVTGTERRVCLDIESRQQFGKKKYGMTVENNPLPLRAWLEHAYYEALDHAVYLRRAMEEIDKIEEAEQIKRGWVPGM